MELNKTDYKRLGDYIREVDVRNRDLKVTKLVGLTIDKAFIPSVANVIGTDLSNYKVIRKKQFACSLMQVSRDQKMPVAMFKEDEAIMSPAYPMFEVINEKVLLPEYLMMWFTRKEFDREASFYAVGGVRGSLTWEDFMDMTLPIPPIERQREIVSEYETLSRRIELNNKMISRLEETAQTLYSKMFIDGIDKENLPDGWRMGTLGEIVDVNTNNYSSKENWTYLKYIDSSSVTENIFEEYQIFNKSDLIPSRAKRKVQKNDILYSTVRPNLKHYGIIKDNTENIIVSTAFAVIRSKVNYFSNDLIYLLLTDPKNTEILQGIAEMSKATYPSITPENILNLKINIPKHIDNEIISINKNIKKIFDYVYLLHQENKNTKKLQSILSTRMGK
ncbi:restriction endonuclease subunit S [Bacteroides sp. ET336]|uniref:restriction endonuclease subunit S n=1 Tax=Bacteroides sp. ET336 TaxID=2972459 RepID=UPI0021ACA332|nr:restriction endonuclease subunit S [Bacteroides sp. ET336]MCR8894647.1 restriction endonuclease subunit S [Bacteroides sp. ET336]MDN0059143.1 restriction endonuclease subunit S [Bacteroides caecigallinarum]